MFKSNLALPLGIAAISTLLVPGASASCGKALVARLSVLVPDGQTLQSMPALSRAAEISDSDLAPAKANDSKVVGLWSTSVLVNGQVIFQAFEAFTGDGLEFLNDNGSPIEGNVCFGTWNSAPRKAITIYHPSWNYDMGGNLIGTVIIKSQITLDPAGDSFKGTVVVDTYDLNGKVSAPELQAQLTGNRVVAH